VATIVITQPSIYPDLYAARLAAARTVLPTATSAAGTKIEGLSNAAPSAANPTGASYISVLVDPAGVNAAAS